LALRDVDLQSQADGTVFGIGVRVIVNGAWGFASSPDVSIASAKKMAEIAVSMAKTSKPLSTEEVTLTPEPVYANQQWVSAYEIDPFAVSDHEKIGRLTDLSAALLKASNVNHSSARSMYVKEQKHYADSYGTSTTQQRVRVQTQIEAISVGAHGFESMRTLAQPAGYGWEWMGNSVWNWDQEIAELPELLGAKVAAPSVTPGKYDLLIHPSNLWLTIHESIGHATEYDRAIGYEAAYAGTSFATPDKLNTMRYGSPVMNVTADRTAEFGLATIGYDAEGVGSQSWDLVRDGVFVGYQLDRVFAKRLGKARSNGCSYADSPHHVPIQRMPNVSLQPGVEDLSTADLISRVDNGIYIVGDKSWSIDMQRYNFQFTGQRFYRIRDGRLDGQVRDVAYQATTTDFWNSMEAVGGASTWRLGGAFNCGKAQPGQVAAVSHGCPSALFRRVNVLNTVEESGR
jgi:TldD protein